MKAGQASDTAAISALMRAAHPLLDTKPWIFVDAMATTLLGLETNAQLYDKLISLKAELTARSSSVTADAFLRAARLGGAVRARYAEDVVAKAQQRGLSQYVILGAGFDSFAYCRRGHASSLRVYELDHPDTQQVKRDRLRGSRTDIPAGSTLVPVDFEQQSVFEALDGTDFRRDQPAVFSFLGVSWYLSEQALNRTLREIAGAAAGSELVMDYLLPPHRLHDEQREVLALLERVASARGEPGHHCLEPEVIAARLQQHGFGEVRDLGADEANVRYFAGREDALRIPELLRVLSARVGQK